MRGLWRELNEFFSSTSIHGFSYISDTQSKSTRIIWTIVVLMALGGASYFLYQTVDGFSKKYVSTTIESKSIQEYPFPAVTFHSGNYNSKDSFLRTFLNQFEFTRYNKNDQLRNNDKFLKMFDWLLSNMNNGLYDDVENYIIHDNTKNSHGKTFLQTKEKVFKTEVCGLIALHNNGNSLQKEIRTIFMANMYKNIINLVI